MIDSTHLSTTVTIRYDLGDAADLILQPVSDPLHDFFGIFCVLALVILHQFAVGGEVEEAIPFLRGQLRGRPE